VPRVPAVREGSRYPGISGPWITAERAPHTEGVDRVSLADFLRRRREALQPADVGLPVGVRRRTAGLRREEVAALAGMSTDYYTRLEQQRGPQPSEQMLTALARGLRLTLDERDHLSRLAGHGTPSRVRRTEHVPPGVMRVLDRLSDTPAQVVTDLGVTLVQNRLAVALLGDQTAHNGPARSAYHRWFHSDPDERALRAEREHATQSRLWAADLRAATSRGTPGADVLVAQLLAGSPEFARVWARHEVAAHSEQRKTLVHPEVGEMQLDCQVLHSEDRGQRLLVFTATPGTVDAQRLELLAVVGRQFTR